MSRQTDFAEIKRLKAKARSWRLEANLWRKRVGEAAKAVEKYEDVCVANTRLREALEKYKTLTIQNCQRCAKYFGWCD